MTTGESIKTAEYMEITPHLMTLDMIRDQFGPVSFAYTKRQGEYYEVSVVSRNDAPILRSFLLIDRIPFLGVEETECKIVN